MTEKADTKAPQESPRRERTFIYVDGFNLYFGMLEAGLRDCKWLNIHRLIEGLLKPGQTIEGIRYFTSIVNNNPDKQRRQVTYIEALETVGVIIHYGKYQSNAVECHRCGNIWKESNEKMTDVNIATHMIADAYQDRYDTAILISGDSDLVPPIRAIHDLFKTKRVTVFFPPKRYSASVASVAKGSLILGKRKIKDSQLSDEVTKSDGFILKKPIEWV